jgi:hypothetical protein
LALAQDPPQLKSVGTTYARAQVATWLDDSHFAVGRWDGTLSIFRTPRAGEFGPVIAFDTVTPSVQAVQMALAVTPTVFVTSNDDHSLAVWKLKDSHYEVLQVPTYDKALGVANSAAQFDWQGKKWIVTGHEQGVIAIWECSADGTLTLKQMLSITSPDPIQSPYHLKNVRGVEHWKDGIVVTGSEDGDIAAIEVTLGKVLFRSRYNPTAQRGINSVSVKDDLLLVANCSVGNSDNNLWLFQISGSGFTKLDATNLKKNQQLPQVFDFDAIFGSSGSNVVFLASTEEGLLWLGTVSNSKLAVVTSTQVSPTGGAALSFDNATHEVLSAAYDLGLFDVTGPATPPH